jgi:hypothetical protein
MNKDKGLFFLKCALLVILAVIVFGWVTMLLWNWLVPDLFHGPLINFYQALGILALSKILFSGLGKKGGSHGPSPYWKQRLHEKFSGMSADQRAEFKRRLNEKWCRFEQKAPGGKTPPSND